MSSIPLRKHLIKHFVMLAEQKWDIAPLHLLCEVFGDAIDVEEENEDIAIFVAFRF